MDPEKNPASSSEGSFSESTMKLASLKLGGAESAALKTSGGYVTLREINRCFGTRWPEDLLTLIQEDRLTDLEKWLRSGAGDPERIKQCSLPGNQVHFAPPYRNPRKIWGIGLNYPDHARDLDETVPLSEPASFLKPDTTLIGCGDTIKIPRLSQKTTAEAELGIIFKKKCKNVERRLWESVIAGYTTIIDMTAEDILRRNPRNLTQAKSFDTFFSFGPVLYTPEDISEVSQLQVSTVRNGKVIAQNTVANMTYPPDYLVWYFTRVMTMLPGDIISTGTPGAVQIKDGDQVECRITGFEPLVNPVVDLKH